MGVLHPPNRYQYEKPDNYFTTIFNSTKWT